MIGPDVSIPTRSPAALAARDIFFENLGKLNFYVEDEDQENLYDEILRKLFPRLEGARVFPLGGKAKVLAHAMDPVNKKRARRSIYIVDKDFDDLLGHKVARKNVFYLDRYCIENYLFEEDAVLQIAVESNPKRKRRDLKKELKLETLHRQAMRSFDGLFRLFFAVQRFNLGIKNCDCAPEQFCQKDKLWCIAPVNVRTYGKQVLKLSIAAGVVKDRAQLDKFLGGAFPKDGPADANISGKFLLQALFHYLRVKANVKNVTFDSLRYRLARNGQLKGLDVFREHLNAHLSTIEKKPA